MSRLLRQDVIPLLFAYGLFIAMLIFSRRGVAVGGDRPDQAGPHRDLSPASLVRHLLLTATLGYGLFLLLVLVFYAILGDQSADFVTEALWGGAVLAYCVAIPVFLIASWLRGQASRIERRRGRAARG